jgi:hypothetical protein
MATGSGLDSQLVVATESTVGTINVATKLQYVPFNSAELTYDPSYIENASIMAGARFKDVAQVGIARKAASGKIEIPVMFNGFGWWMKHILGSAAVPAADGTGGAFKGVYAPGGLKGLSFTAQVGKPEPGTGTIQPRTYNGCKVTDWDLTFADNAVTLLAVSVDAWNEDQATSLVSPVTFPVGNQAYNFAQVNQFLTAQNNDLSKVSAASNVMTTTMTGTNAVPSVATKLTLSGKASLATERYGLGNAGVKKEQLENDFFEITGAFEGEYDAATWETPFRNGDTVAIQLTSTGPTITGSSPSVPYMIDILIPAAKITKAPAPVSGPDIVQVSGEFTVYDPNKGSGATDCPPIQVTIRSTDIATAF